MKPAHILTLTSETAVLQGKPGASSLQTPPGEPAQALRYTRLRRWRQPAFKSWTWAAISLKSLTACSWAGPAQPPGPTPWLIPLLSAAPRRGAALWPLTGERINGAKVVQIKAECGEWSKGHRWRPGGGEGVSGASGCYQSPLTPNRCSAASDLRSLLAASLLAGIRW